MVDGAAPERMGPPGSAGWWLARLQVPKARRLREDGITLDRIVETAVDIVRAYGHEALTMRRLADQLGTGPASLYRHVASREELIALIVDHVVSSGAGKLPAGGDWRAAAERLARLYRKHLLANREFVPLLASAQMLGPNAIRAREAGVALFVRAGFSPDDAVRSYLTIVRFVMAEVQLDVRWAARTEAERRLLRELFASQDPQQCPMVVEHAGTLASQSSDDEFEFGLAAILEGISRRQEVPD